MKLNSIWLSSRLPVVTFLWISVAAYICGCLGARNERMKLDDEIQGAQSGIHTNVLVSSVTKVKGNSAVKTKIMNFECRTDDKDCEKDRLGFDAIRSLHLMIDDDHDGDVDLSESDEFLRDELQYTDGFDRQQLFHNNDKLISVDDLWEAWKHSTVYNWTVDDMVEWLVQDVDLPQYSHVFYSFTIDGSFLPRLVNSTSPLLASLGIRNPVHKQKLSLKAMDTILFGAPRRIHSYAKDVILFTAILLTIGISWFACLHHRYSQTQVRKMMKDLESLQKAEDALKKLSKELADAESSQISMAPEKQEELRMLRQNSLRLQVPRLGGGDKSPTRYNRETYVRQKQEGDIKLKQAHEELANLREALSEAENRLEIQQQLESQWSVPCELQAWLQLTFELEQVHFNAKRQAAERQLMVARDGCEKVKKRKQAFFGALRMAHSNSLDDIDQSILDARAALEEVKQDLQERLHRWHTVEVLCGFLVISNPGLSSLKMGLGRDTGSSARLPNSLISPIVTFDEADEDIQSTGDDRESDLYNQIPEGPRQQIFAWAHRSRHIYWTKQKMLTNDDNVESDSEYVQIPERPRQQIFAWAHRSRHVYWAKKKALTNDENRDSQSIYNQIPERPRQQIFAWAHRGRLNNWLKKKTMTTNGYTPMTSPASSKALTFHKQQTATGSAASLSYTNKVTSPSSKGGTQDGDLQGALTTNSPPTMPASSTASSVVFQLGENFKHERSQSSASLSLLNSSLTNGSHHGHAQGKIGVNQFSHGTSASAVTFLGLHGSSSSGNLLTSKTRAGHSSLKMYTSASGNHLSAKTNVPQSNTPSATATHNSEATSDKFQLNDTGDIINNNVTSHGPDRRHSNGHDALPESPSDSLSSITKSHQKSTHLDNADAVTVGPNQPKTQHDRIPELDISSLETDSLNDSRSGKKEISGHNRNGKKKTLLPKFLQKSKGKQKTV